MSAVAHAGLIVVSLWLIEVMASLRLSEAVAAETMLIAVKTFGIYQIEHFANSICPLLFDVHYGQVSDHWQTPNRREEGQGLAHDGQCQ